MILHHTGLNKSTRPTFHAQFLLFVKRYIVIRVAMVPCGLSAVVDLVVVSR